MIRPELIKPSSIAVIGGSTDTKKPGGKVLQNLAGGTFEGALYVVNPKNKDVQGLPTYPNVDSLPPVALAILAIPAAHCYAAAKTLLEEKETKALIVLSAGFGEAGPEGIARSQELVALVNKHGANLIGPNCIGVMNAHYQGVFTTPIPPLVENSCDLISNSGATAVFIMEAGMSLGVTFSNVFSVGNAAQIGIEEVLEYMDANYDAKTSAPIKLLYIEGLKQPQKFLKHAKSLVEKGAKIAAINAGVSQVGSRAVSSHTGSLASSDVAMRALFKKAGIVYCSGREELLSVASIYSYKKPKGRRVVIITHAGGSAVMLADALSKGNIEVPPIEGPQAQELLGYLHNGSSVANPIDFLATGTAEQLGIIIDYCEHKFDHIDAMVVVFGSPGLFDVESVYNVLSVKIDTCKKPIYPVLPSVINARQEIEHFTGRGHSHFTDEVVLGEALGAVLNTSLPKPDLLPQPVIDHKALQQILANSGNGFIAPENCNAILDTLHIKRLDEHIVSREEELDTLDLHYPCVLKVIGPVHKTEVGGVKLHIKTLEEAKSTFQQLMEIPEATGVLVQPMISGVELFLGVSHEPGFGKIIMCGLGGILVEVIADVRAGLVPVSHTEATQMINSIKGKKILDGYRNLPAVDKSELAGIIQHLSAFAAATPELQEMDINPIVATKDGLVAIDTRIKINHNPNNNE